MVAGGRWAGGHPRGDTHLQISGVRSRQGFQHKSQSLGQEEGSRQRCNQGKPKCPSQSSPPTVHGGDPQLTNAEAVRHSRVSLLQVPAGRGRLGSASRAQWGRAGVPAPPAILTGWESVEGCSSSPSLWEDNRQSPPSWTMHPRGCNYASCVPPSNADKGQPPPCYPAAPHVVREGVRPTLAMEQPPPLG